ncbi:phospho-N-acetylmuramoyl-pentapeptide-transferase [Patescibacteria group bacterium]|nr:phospho-N-acetylmuramoyl-pentapeptide-transferase [Patescibacteria group bacterium]
MALELDFTKLLINLTLIFLSFASAFIFAVIMAEPFIKLLKKFKIHKQIREIASTGEKASLYHELHKGKAGTPTMGGILIWGTVALIVFGSTFLSYIGWIDHSLFNRQETWLPLATLIGVGLLGAVDDFFNIKGIGKSKGINIRPKFFFLLIFALLGALWFHYKLGYDQINIPGIGDIYLGLWYIPLFMLVITSTANAVNFTDGLDGLAGGLLTIAFGSFGIISFTLGMYILAAFCAIIVGALVAFLWHNVPPAKLYMGDTGALSLGATLGVIAMLTDSFIPLILIGFVFVIETLSIIIQIFSKKVFKKKVFKIAPLHHHFEYIGWPETKVVMRFWIIGGMFAMIGLILALLAIFVR